MIIAERKPLEQIETMLEGRERILVVGCGACAAVCLAGGEKQVELLAAQLRMKGKLDGRMRRVDETTVTRQCDREYLVGLAKHVADCDAVLSMGCGAGVQLLAECYPGTIVLPALNTLFIGVTEEQGVWTERCSACAECVLDLTGGICPMTVCAKNLLNGPCGGTDAGKCEVNGENDCAWTLIWRRLEALGRLDQLRAIQPPKDYSVMAKPRKHTHRAFEVAREED